MSVFNSVQEFNTKHERPWSLAMTPIGGNAVVIVEFFDRAGNQVPVRNGGLIGSPYVAAFALTISATTAISKALYAAPCYDAVQGVIPGWPDQAVTMRGYVDSGSIVYNLCGDARGSHTAAGAIANNAVAAALAPSASVDKGNILVAGASFVVGVD
jgi:hypothetical protein